MILAGQEQWSRHQYNTMLLIAAEPNTSFYYFFVGVKRIT